MAGLPRAVTVKVSAGASVSSEGSSGARGPTSVMARSHRWQAGSDCWQDTPFQGWLLWGLECPHGMAASLPQMSHTREQSGRCNVLPGSASEVTHPHSRSILLATQPSSEAGREDTPAGMRSSREAPCGEGTSSGTTCLTMPSSALLQLFAQPLVSKRSSTRPSAQQTFPRSFPSSASPSPGASPRSVLAEHCPSDPSRACLQGLGAQTRTPTPYRAP